MLRDDGRSVGLELSDGDGGFDGDVGREDDVVVVALRILLGCVVTSSLSETRRRASSHKQRRMDCEGS